MANVFFQNILERLVIELYRGKECKAVRIFISQKEFDRLDKFSERQPVIFNPKDGEVIEISVLASDKIIEWNYEIHYGGDWEHVGESDTIDNKN